jgi:hypothetical protein
MSAGTHGRWQQSILPGPALALDIQRGLAKGAGDVGRWPSVYRDLPIAECPKSICVRHDKHFLFFLRRPYTRCALPVFTASSQLRCSALVTPSSCGLASWSLLAFPVQVSRCCFIVSDSPEMQKQKQPPVYLPPYPAIEHCCNELLDLLVQEHGQCSAVEVWGRRISSTEATQPPKPQHAKKCNAQCKTKDWIALRNSFALLCPES